MSRSLLVCSTAVAAICSILGLATAIYALMSTPNIQDMPVYTDQRVLRFANKFVHLLWPVLVQIVLFGVSLYHSIKWQAFSRHILESAAKYNAQPLASGRVDAHRLYRILCFASMGFEILILAVVL